MAGRQKLLITGSSGFVGEHLSRFLLSKKFLVFGIDLNEPDDKKLFEDKNFNFIKLDLLDSIELERNLKKIKPEGIFHLAGQSNVFISWQQPLKTIESNLLVGFNLLKTLVNIKYQGKLILILSGEEYGSSCSPRNFFSENDLINPLNPYSASKASLDFLSQSFYYGFGLKIIRLRPFNHIGPGQKETFVVSDFARQIALIETGKKNPEILVGNLKTFRDFLDVRDIVCAYYLAFKKCVPGEVYNICSGKAVSIEKVLKVLLSFSKVKAKVKIDKKKIRKVEQKFILGDNTKFIRTTGWKPKIPLKKSLKDSLDYWRKKIVYFK